MLGQSFICDLSGEGEGNIIGDCGGGSSNFKDIERKRRFEMGRVKSADEMFEVDRFKK